MYTCAFFGVGTPTVVVFAFCSSARGTKMSPTGERLSTATHPDVPSTVEITDGKGLKIGNYRPESGLVFEFLVHCSFFNYFNVPPNDRNSLEDIFRII